jgi:hypothetical protein
MPGGSFRSTACHQYIPAGRTGLDPHQKPDIAGWLNRAMSERLLRSAAFLIVFEILLSVYGMWRT